MTQPWGLRVDCDPMKSIIYFCILNFNITKYSIVLLKNILWDFLVVNPMSYNIIIQQSYYLINKIVVFTKKNLTKILYLFITDVVMMHGLFFIEPSADFYAAKSSIVWIHYFVLNGRQNANMSKYNTGFNSRNRNVIGFKCVKNIPIMMIPMMKCPIQSIALEMNGSSWRLNATSIQRWYLNFDILFTYSVFVFFKLF